MRTQVRYTPDLQHRTVTYEMAKLTAIIAFIALAAAGAHAAGDKPGGFNIMPQDLMACSGSSSRTRLGA